MSQLNEDLNNFVIFNGGNQPDMFSIVSSSQ